jgi:phosphatidylinositol-3,4,5-trisphosphate 3-phosphatase/dual-specificity protein phosphatase PTEN
MHVLTAARHIDQVSLTDRLGVIIMGYPAIGVQNLYRNRREDVKAFLKDHHGLNFWVFNLYPIRENSYPESVFDGRRVDTYSLITSMFCSLLPY